MTRILHLDMDAFFAAVEEKRRPELKGKPVVIGAEGNPSSRGVAATASYEARKYGIRSAMPLRTAFKLCPQAIFLPVDYDEYVRVSKIFKGVLREFSPVMEDVGIDEAYLDISGVEGPPVDIALEIKRRILEETGLTCSIGIAPNKLLAKIASDMKKPEGITVIAEGDVKNRIWPLPVRKLLGVGPKTETSLNKMSIETIGDLAARPLDELVQTFGNSFGAYLHEAAHGVDDSPVVTHWEPKSVSRETTFHEDTGKWQTVARTIAELTREVAAELRESSARGRNVTLKVRFGDFQTLTRSLTLAEATASEETIRRAAFECLKRVELKKRVRLVGVRVSRLEKGTA